MDITNRYVLDFAREYCSRHPGARVLDFGCGGGAVVAEGRRCGLEIYGTDIFYGGSKAREEAERRGLLGRWVLPMAADRIPFPDGYFKLVVNNQVMEHVEDLETTLSELHRVLSRDGALLSIFPSKEVFREGHIGIPFVHWFPRDSRVRFWYALLWRCAGFGYWKDQAATPTAWVHDKLHWLDKYTRYRPRREVLGQFARFFETQFIEPDYIRYRMRATRGLGWLARVVGWPVVTPAGVWLFRHLAFMVLLSRKRSL